MFKHILVAVDGSAVSNRGLKTAIDLAADQDTDLDVVHVIDTYFSTPAQETAYFPAQYSDQLIEARRHAGRNVLAKAESMAAARGIATRTVLVESAGHSVARAILAQVRKRRADVVVMGTHGRRGLSRALTGSDAETVLRGARVPVLLVRLPEDGARSGAPRKSRAKA